MIDTLRAFDLDPHTPVAHRDEANLILLASHPTFRILVIDTPIVLPGYMPDSLRGVAGIRGAIVTTTVNPYYGSVTPLLVAKTIRHELGHLQGRLGHCLERGCIMTFCGSRLELEKRGGSLCERCQRIIDAER